MVTECIIHLLCHTSLYKVVGRRVFKIASRFARSTAARLFNVLKRLTTSAIIVHSPSRPGGTQDFLEGCFRGVFGGQRADEGRKVLLSSGTEECVAT